MWDDQVVLCLLTVFCASWRVRVSLFFGQSVVVGGRRVGRADPLRKPGGKIRRSRTHSSRDTRKGLQFEGGHTPSREASSTVVTT